MIRIRGLRPSINVFLKILLLKRLSKGFPYVLRARAHMSACCGLVIWWWIFVQRTLAEHGDVTAKSMGHVRHIGHMGHMGRSPMRPKAPSLAGNKVKRKSVILGEWNA